MKETIKKLMESLTREDGVLMIGKYDHELLEIALTKAYNAGMYSYTYKHDDQCNISIGKDCDCYVKIDTIRKLLNVPDELRIGQHIVNEMDDPYYVSDAKFITLLDIRRIP